MIFVSSLVVCVIVCLLYLPVSFCHYCFRFPFLSETISKRIFQAADYHALPNRKIQKFGDIIGMASGRLEINEHGGAVIVELPENCIKLCADEYLADRNVSGVWSVEKIRHRDEHRGHRFELKITIRPLKRNRSDAKRDPESGNGLSKSRSFLIKDDDYPQYFTNGQQYADDISERTSNQRIEKRIFNILYDNTEIPFHLNYGRSPNVPLVYGLGQNSHLNIGEYYMGRPPVPAAASFHPRPLRFGVGSHPPNGLPNQIPPGSLHHHYYLNKEEVPIYKASLFENGNIFAQHGAHGPLVLPNHVTNMQYSTIRNPQSQHVENQIRPNEFFNSFSPTPSNPIQFHGTESEAGKFSGAVKGGAYDDNRETILDGEHHKYIVSQFDVQNNNLLNSAPSKEPGHGQGITPTPYVFQIDASSPTSAPISFYSEQQTHQHHQQPHHQQPQPQQQHVHHHPQQQHPNQNHVVPSSVYSSQQLANQLYWFGDGQQPRNPNVNFESSFPFHENTFSELDPVYHGNGQSISSIGPEQSVLVTPGNVANIHPTAGFGQDSNREASQSPAQHSSHGYTVSNEDQSTTQENTEPNLTTPYVLSTTNSYTQHLNDGKPDSINAQLPPPDSDDDLTVPYVDASVHTEKPYSPIRLIERPVGHSKSEYVTTENRNDQIELASTDVPNKMVKLFDTDQRTAIQVRYKGEKSTAEQKQVKWTPKRTRQRKPTTAADIERKEYRRRKVTTNSTTTTSTSASRDVVDDNKPEIITAKSIYFHDEPRTSQSVKKTVSIRIGSNEGMEPTTTSTTTPPPPPTTTTTTTITPVSTTTPETPPNTSTNLPDSHTFATQNDKPFVPTPIGRSNVTRLAMIRRVDSKDIDNERNYAKRTRFLG